MDLDISRGHFVPDLQIECCGPRPGRTSCASLRSRNALGRCARGIMLKFTGRMPEPRTGDQTLCEPTLSKCIWRFHKNRLCQNLPVKCRGPEPRPTLCASLRSRNALGRFTRAVFTVLEIHRENARTQMEHPRHTVCFFLMYIFICTRIFPSTYPTYLPLFKKCWSPETMHLLPSLPGGRSLGAKRKARGCGHGGCHKATGQRMWWGPVILRLPFQVN